MPLNNNVVAKMSLVINEGYTFMCQGSDCQQSKSRPKVPRAYPLTQWQKKRKRNNQIKGLNLKKFARDE